MLIYVVAPVHSPSRTQTYDIRAARRGLGYGLRIMVAEGVVRTLVAAGRG